MQDTALLSFTSIGFSLYLFTDFDHHCIFKNSPFMLVLERILGMPNIALILKAEIRRIARREIRLEYEALKKQVNGLKKLSEHKSRLFQNSKKPLPKCQVSLSRPISTAPRLNGAPRGLPPCTSSASEPGLSCHRANWGNSSR